MAFSKSGRSNTRRSDRSCLKALVETDSAGWPKGAEARKAADVVTANVCTASVALAARAIANLPPPVSPAREGQVGNAMFGCVMAPFLTAGVAATLLRSSMDLLFAGPRMSRSEFAEDVRRAVEQAAAEREDLGEESQLLEDEGGDFFIPPSQPSPSATPSPAASTTPAPTPSPRDESPMSSRPTTPVPPDAPRAPRSRRRTPGAQKPDTPPSAT